MNRHFAKSLVVLCLIGVAGTAGAAPGDGRMSRGHHGMGEFGNPARLLEHMVRRLDLTEDQEQRIGNILDAAAPEFEALRGRASDVREAIAELDTSDPNYDVSVQDLAREVGEVATSMTLLHGRLRAEIATELTPEQAAKLKERRGRMSEWFRGHRRHRDAAESE